MHPTRARGSTALQVWHRERLPQLTLVSRLAASAATEPEADLLTRAYVLVLAAEFQGFFSDLLSDITPALADALPAEVPPLLRHMVKVAMGDGRAVDFRNPDSTTLRRDLVRFDMEPRALLAGEHGGRLLLARLDQVIGIRNKLAHGSGSVADVGADGGPLTLVVVDQWRRDLDRLATILNNAVASSLDTRLSISLATKEPP